MSHINTIFHQILKFVPRHQFEKLAKEHHKGSSLRSVSRWDQFVAMTTSQLSGRKSLRDLTSNLKIRSNRLYHLGGTSYFSLLFIKTERRSTT